MSKWMDGLYMLSRLRFRPPPHPGGEGGKVGHEVMMHFLGVLLFFPPRVGHGNGVGWPFTFLLAGNLLGHTDVFCGSLMIQCF